MVKDFKKKKRSVMEPLLDNVSRLVTTKLSRFKKPKPFTVVLIGMGIFFLPSLLFVIGITFGHNVIFPPGEKTFPTEFEPDPGEPMAFFFSALIAAVSPFVVLPAAGKRGATFAFLTIVFWVFLFIQVCFVMIIGDLQEHHWQLFRC